MKDKTKQKIKEALIVAIITILIVAPVTYFYTKKSIDYQKELEEELVLKFIGGNEFNAEPSKTYQFNSVSINNPSGRPISIEKIYYKASTNFFQNQISDEEKEKIPVELPDFSQSKESSEEFKPYMEIESGKTEKMSGLFYIAIPEKEGDYNLQFCAVTYSNKEFCTEGYLTLHVQ